MNERVPKKVLALIVTLLLTLSTMSQYAIPTFAEETETNITDKVTIDSITSPNAEIKDSTNVNDFSTSVRHGADVDYKIDLTVNKGTPILSGDYIELPVTADHGQLYESAGLSVIDSEDGSLLGEATITKDKIRIKFTKKNNDKTAAKLTISTTMKGVSYRSQGFSTQTEVDAAYASEPTGIDKIKIHDKNVNVNVKANYWAQENEKEKFFGEYPVPAIGDSAVFFKKESGKAGGTSSTNTSTSWGISVNKPAYKYKVTSPVTGKENDATTDASTTAAFLFGYDKAFGLYPATENVYVEDLLPGDTYKNLTFDGSLWIRGTHLYKDGKTPILKQSYVKGKPTTCYNPSAGGNVKIDDFFTKKEAAAGQSYDDFKASLKTGEYGIYKSPNGDIRLVMNFGKAGSKDPASMYTWGDLCDKLGKEKVITSFFPTYEVTADNALKRVQIPVDTIYNQIKDWPITDFSFSFSADLVKPVLRTGAYVENTATVSQKQVTAKNFFVVGEISLYTYKDGVAIMKTDAKTGLGVEKAEFKLQEKDPAGNWVDSDSQFVKDYVTVVGNGGSKNGDRFYTNENGVLNIRGLLNGKSYRLMETKAPAGYESSNPAVSKEFAISFTDKDAQGDNKDFTLTNKKSEYKVTYKIVKNPAGEEIPAGSPAAPVDSKMYNLNATVDVKPDLSMAGYIFTGWHTESGQKVTVKDNDSSFTMPNGDVELVGYWIKNTTENTTEVSGEKTWNDADNQDGARPSEITVNLLKNGAPFKTATVKADADGNWKYSFTNLPKYENGQEVKYSVTEDTVAGYTAKVSGYDIKNSYTPGKTSVTVTKSWDDANNQDGKRPDSVKVQLYGDGNKVGNEVELTDGNWTYTWNNLPEKKAGKTIKYTVKEVGTADGYTTSYSDENQGNIVITNKHVPETTSVEGQKTWDDSNNQDGKRPSEITVNLLKNGAPFKTATVKADADGNWKYSFTNLPKYENGQEVKYSVTENAVEAYNTKIEGYNIKNSYTPEETSVTVTKNWKDANDRDGIRPGSIKVQLYANGEKKGKPIELNAGSNWTYTWNNLPQKADGKDIEYTVKEIKTPSGYVMSVNDRDHGNIIITNSHTPKATGLPDTGDHTWLLPYSVLMILSGAASLGLFALRRRMAE
ncbi:Cna B-type domain-containing protein [Lancefieldella rimae]|uniref:Cna B-type domain-containing protein n=1 Tax=Lancefieldella rimae TaxID=1383 RepID=UPI0028EE1B1E|nr:Cna B-type domain-containing protein [Lancefieldella rimae]